MHPPSGTEAAGSETSLLKDALPWLVVLVLAIASLAAGFFTSGVLSIVCIVVGLFVTAGVAYLVSPLLIFVLLERDVETSRHPRRGSVRARAPWYVWAATVLFVGAWAFGAWAYGYDRTEWLWSGVSAAVGWSTFLLLVSLRRRAGVAGEDEGPIDGDATGR